MLQHLLIALLMVVLAFWCSGVISSVNEQICDKSIRARCSIEKLQSNASQFDILKTFTYDVFNHGNGSFCVPFDFSLENGETLRVFSYYACNYGGKVAESNCDRCLRKGRINLQQVYCPNSAGGVYRSRVCCLRYETYNMCAAL
ncbi:hypothetical protein LINPERHAP1_LOCUS27304 [Linum perenne]